ncbi:hypothetical protein E5206_15270 [Arthrobacter sp. PAMC25564]|uniref:hypothetical protein n=1 Tax=Arthrobacter sp. PAMC25564 TaxID=2565366 RepID=UPI0010A202D5|nr:hypothetical protein [Arthrobacter sp. PAMC25564]QCB98101.1 hypothetical protein E5206_15270 [Arthrobacter sp. PAMC25564]
MADAPLKDPAASVSVRGLPDRGRVLCHGFIESVTYAPASQVAHFVAIVVDHDAPPARNRATASQAGSGATPAGVPDGRVQSGVQRQRATGPKDRLRVVWLGRRRIPGIDAGTELRLQGMVTIRDGLPTMFNPRYEILSRQEEQ